MHFMPKSSNFPPLELALSAEDPTWSLLTRCGRCQTRRSTMPWFWMHPAVYKLDTGPCMISYVFRSCNPFSKRHGATLRHLLGHLRSFHYTCGACKCMIHSQYIQLKIKFSATTLHQMNLWMVVKYSIHGCYRFHLENDIWTLKSTLWVKAACHFFLANCEWFKLQCPRHHVLDHVSQVPTPISKNIKEYWWNTSVGKHVLTKWIV